MSIQEITIAYVYEDRRTHVRGELEVLAIHKQSTKSIFKIPDLWIAIII